MFDITIIAVGALTGAWKEAGEEYVKRVKPFARVRTVEVKAEPFRSASDRERALTKEGDRLLKAIDSARGFVVLLDEQGKEYTSVQFANMLEKQHGGAITFVVGGALGFSSAVRDRVSDRLALSRMTVPHETARVMLLEQVYRAATIVGNKTYHY